MSSSAVETGPVVATKVSVTNNTLCVELADGRTIAAPLAWYPRLAHGTATERKSWRLIASGRGIHWPDLSAIQPAPAFAATPPAAAAKGAGQYVLVPWRLTVP